MKKAIVILANVYLLFLFLLYCGVFRNDRNPENVTRYYYDCVRNGEWFLTYQIYASDYFDPLKIIDESSAHNFVLIGKIKPGLLSKEGNRALVLTELFYKNKEHRYDLVELELEDGTWLIRGIKYNYTNS